MLSRICPNDLTTLIANGTPFDRVKLIGSEIPVQHDLNGRRFIHLDRGELNELRSQATACGPDKEVLRGQWSPIVLSTANPLRPNSAGQSDIFMDRATPSAYWLTNWLNNEAITQAEDSKPFKWAVEWAVNNRRPAISSKGFYRTCTFTGARQRYTLHHSWRRSTICPSEMRVISSSDRRGIYSWHHGWPGY